MRKKIVLIILAILVITCPAFSEDSLSGEALKELGLIEGDGSGLNESGDITREALVKIVVSLSVDLREDFILPESPTFLDVANDHWAYSWVERAYAEGLTRGVGNGYFGLGQRVNKQQVAAFMLNVLNENYEYKDAIELASNRGISTNVYENFNRGNAFEMVSKTLLQKPVGLDKALFESNQNFSGKNFKQILASIDLRRDEARRAAQAMAEAERLAQQESTMAKYRSTWPNKLETYLAWLIDMDRLLESSWQPITAGQYKDKNRINHIFKSEEVGQNYLFVDIALDNTMTIKPFGVSQDFSGETRLKGITIYHSEAYEAYKILGEDSGHKIELLQVKDSNSMVSKGFINIGDDRYYMNLSNFHHIVENMGQVREALYAPSFDAPYDFVEFDLVKRYLVDDMKMNMVIYEVVPDTQVQYIVGLDEYTLFFKQMTSDKLTVKKSFDQETEVLTINHFERNLTGDIFNLYMENSQGKPLVFIFKLDEKGEIIDAFLQYHNHYGVYIQE